jgi:hypothetical protein
MMASEQGWRDLRLAFEAILHRDLRNTWIEAVYYPQGFDGTGRVGIPGLPGKWDVHNGADERGRSDFRQLAKAAAVADGCPNIEAGWIYWLEAIRANSLGTPTPGVNRSDGHERVDWVQRARGQDHREPIICNGYELQPFYDRDTFRVYKNEPIIQFENVCYTSGQYCMLLAAGGVRRPSELVPTNGGILDDASRLETQGPTASAERQREQRAKASRPKPSPTLATNLSELRQFTSEAAPQTVE